MTPEERARLLVEAVRGLRSDDDEIWIEIIAPVIAKALREAATALASLEGEKEGFKRAHLIANSNFTKVVNERNALQSQIIALTASNERLKTLMAPSSPAAFVNAIAEEGTKEEAIYWLQKTWDELCEVRRTFGSNRSNAIRSKGGDG